MRGQHRGHVLLALRVEREPARLAVEHDALRLLLLLLRRLADALLPSGAAVGLGDTAERIVDVLASSGPRRLAARAAVALPAHAIFLRARGS